jgi:hypothetical protein
VAFDPSIYPQNCLEAATVAYAEFLRLDPYLGKTGISVLDIVILPAFSSNETQLRREFLNYLLDLSVQHHLTR